jgi:large subunit ribosomal protein L29
MKIAEIKEMNIEQLKKLVDEKRTEAVKLRFDISMRQLKNNRQYREVRKDIARALTVIKQLEQ